MSGEGVIAARPAFEAVINGGESIFDCIDPVVRIIIDNGFHQYEFEPGEITTLEIRPIATRADPAHNDE